MELVFPHLHHKVSHFSLGFALSSVLFDILSIFAPKFERTSDIMIVLATLSLFLSFITGVEISEGVVVRRTLLEYHETSGFLMLSVFSIALALRFSMRTRSLSKLLVIFSLPLIIFVDISGVVLSHLGKNN